MAILNMVVLVAEWFDPAGAAQRAGDGGAARAARAADRARRRWRVTPRRSAPPASRPRSALARAPGRGGTSAWPTAPRTPMPAASASRAMTANSSSSWPSRSYGSAPGGPREDVGVRPLDDLAVAARRGSRYVTRALARHARDRLGVVQQRDRVQRRTEHEHLPVRLDEPRERAPRRRSRRRRDAARRPTRARAPTATTPASGWPLCRAPGHVRTRSGMRP